MCHIIVGNIISVDFKISAVHLDQKLEILLLAFHFSNVFFLRLIFLLLSAKQKQTKKHPLANFCVDIGVFYFDAAMYDLNIALQYVFRAF